ncbi:MAG: glutathione S-transferase family protein [Drouetiella hepatica Uher 2000/2452]|jgi:glutathione S-transferase|uniref:Glutathione S-transferase family protein n=1 Tax=Drouetiella hepatica Uher 2000/2452 TaxID=904376 RepID=A0A951QG91_9CYAN|nr:glutathione S-transferase family protein [Drouetiella hepatica Uher 2000/2452]
MYKLYDYRPSGNGYKVRLLLTQLGIPYEYIEKNIIKGETRTPEFLAINPNGRIPVLELEPGVYLAESNAILIYLSESTAFLPSDRLNRAYVMQWLFFEQYSHEPNIATSRFIMSYLQKTDEYREVLEKKRELGYAALDVMEKRLADHLFLVGDYYTIADIALFAYTHVAEEGGFSLEPYPGIRAWIDRIKNQPDHIQITQSHLA